MTFEIRTSERSTFKRCPQRWLWSMVEGLEPIRAANPLWFGQGVHIALAEWYLPGTKRGPHPAETFSSWVDQDRNMRVRNDDDELEWVDARELGISMLEAYVDEYGVDDSWDVIAPEMTFDIWFYRTFEGKRTKWFRYVGTWDGVYRDRSTGEIWLMEHKTAAAISTSHLPLDDQAGTYFTMANKILRKRGVLKPKERIAGVMYNFLRKAKQDERPRNEEGLYLNKNGSVSARQPASYFHREPLYKSVAEEKRIIQRIKDEALYIEAIREGDPAYPVLKVITQFGPSACAQCPFFRMCQLDEQGDQDSVEDFKASWYNVRDPYADHQIKAA